ncbi:anti-sigma-28 factor, FlgM family [Tindallia magadiensis]|uniref:Anti-sigma-28 factor, FlgM family n=1 Tax=Tindallia magadiensis TaxID=69895 RepID=A0A1I3C684_9FIRM|nr:flagellar biosynthesis anti-sigma factor FlgM [Tindallia magadiensis]SFH70054.1 anti-sigma-28 factor, FlgM family [Tindallia magadiensis]
MKIQNHPQIIQAMRSYQNNKTKATETKQKTSMVQDKMDLSEKAIDFQTAVKAYQKLPEIREERVQEVKEKMARGEGATPEEVVEKMLADLNVRSKI